MFDLLAVTCSLPNNITIILGSFRRTESIALDRIDTLT